MLELLEAEVNICLGLLGVNSLQELNTSYLHTVQALEPSSALSAFPLLSIEEKSFY
jgi:glycolate oxidase